MPGYTKIYWHNRPKYTKIQKKTKQYLVYSWSKFKFKLIFHKRDPNIIIFYMDMELTKFGIKSNETGHRIAVRKIGCYFNYFAHRK
jgi:hypothetical protein